MTCDIDGGPMKRKLQTDPSNIQKPALYSLTCEICGNTTIKETSHDRAVRLGRRSKSYDTTTATN